MHCTNSERDPKKGVDHHRASCHLSIPILERHITRQRRNCPLRPSAPHRCGDHQKAASLVDRYVHTPRVVCRKGRDHFPRSSFDVSHAVAAFFHRHGHSIK